MSEAFEGLSRALAAPTSRRRALGVIAGTLGATALGTTKAKKAAAQQVVCPDPQVACGNTCCAQGDFCCAGFACCRAGPQPDICCPGTFNPANNPDRPNCCPAGTVCSQIGFTPPGGGLCPLFGIQPGQTVCCDPTQICGQTCCPQGCGQCVNGQCCDLGRVCVNAQNVPTACCAPGQACNTQTGTCFSCAAGSTACGNTCCPPGFTCQGGQCVCAGPNQSCSGGGACCQAANQVCCPNPNAFGGTACVNFRTDPNNCGGCGVVCPAGQTCQNGQCVGPVCQAPNFLCGNQCCAPNQQCINGVCQGPPPCNAPNFLCGNQCCNPNQQCVNGVCQGPPPCPPGSVACPNANACCPQGSTCLNAPNGPCCPNGQIVTHNPVASGNQTPTPLGSPGCCTNGTVCQRIRQGITFTFCCPPGTQCRGRIRRRRCR